MNKINKHELKQLLNNVSDCYFDFMIAMIDEAKKSEARAVGMMEFLKTHPNALSSDVLEYVINDLGLYQEYITGRYPSNSVQTVSM